MSRVNEVMDESILWRDFIYGEIVKRHVEEYAPRILSELRNIRDSLCSEYEHVDNIFLVVIGLAVDCFDSYNQNREQILDGNARIVRDENPQFFDFSNQKNKEHYSKLCSIGKKYNFPPTDLLYPCDIKNIIDNYSKTFIPPTSFRFNKCINDAFKIKKNNDHLVFDAQNAILTDENIDYLQIQIINNKIINNKKITTKEINIYNRYEKMQSTDKFRKDSIIRYLFGLLAWDYGKHGFRNNMANDIYAKHKYANGSCDGYQCDAIKNEDCPSQEGCLKFMQEARQSVSNCIHEAKLLGSKVNKVRIKPTCTSKITRFPLSFFGIQ